MSFTEKEIKEIKQSKRFGYVLSAWIFLFGSIGIWMYAKGEDADFIALRIFVLGVMLIGLCLLVIYGMNRKLNKDLKYEEKLIEIKSIDKLVIETSYEAGSGSLHIPILGDLFPKIWGQKMKGSLRHYMIIGTEKYDVKEEIYKQLKEGDKVEIHWSKHSEIFFGIKYNYRQ